ncbi:MAG: hypothetical protein RJA98_122 [Pseudomonadota bacterium]|jgi:hypothetical protein
MDSPQHHNTMTDLFDQLGLPSSPEAISTFFSSHRDLPLTTRLWEAPFWSPSQASFLQEGLQADGDWAEIIDALNASLRRQPPLGASA